jgi:hypothetical protein
MQGGRSQQTMPEDRTGWHRIDAGPRLDVTSGRALPHKSHYLSRRDRVRSTPRWHSSRSRFGFEDFSRSPRRTT